jgi:hypothetical protein
MDKINIDLTENTQPFEQIADGTKDLTVRDFIEMMQALPPEVMDYAVSFDSACGYVMKRDMLICGPSKKISING